MLTENKPYTLLLLGWLRSSYEKDPESGLYYAGARYQVPRLGSFNSTDPLWWKSPDKTSYHYCSNNPVRYIDPDGRMVVDVLGDPPKWWTNGVDKWNRLNNKEKDIIRWDVRFYKANSIEKNADAAFKMTEATYGRQGKGDESDAFRHAFWQAINTQSVGESFTRKWADAHEYGTPTNEVRTVFIWIFIIMI